MLKSCASVEDNCLIALDMLFITYLFYKLFIIIINNVNDIIMNNSQKIAFLAIFKYI